MGDFKLKGAFSSLICFIKVEFTIWKNLKFKYRMIQLRDIEITNEVRRKNEYTTKEKQI